MVNRSIISIDRNLCNGCEQCIGICAEAALDMDSEGKAIVVNETFCDGLGACLDVCPTGALVVVERESENYDAKATFDHVKRVRGEAAALQVHDAPIGIVSGKQRVISQLSQWPVQLKLVSPTAPYFTKSDILIVADCVPFAYSNFHSEMLKGKALVVACPKLDDTASYISKLVDILKHNVIYSVTVGIMSVPCCDGLQVMVEKAVSEAGFNMHIKTLIVDIKGSLE